MPDVFISYSVKDSDLAHQFKNYMESHEISTFMAEVSIEPGQKWKDAIIAAFNESKWIFFLATPSSCVSKAVMHELGGAVFGKKQIITILCDIEAKDIPEWVQDTQAIDLKKQDEIVGIVQKIANTIRSDKFIAGLIAGALLMFAALVFLGTKGSEKGSK